MNVVKPHRMALPLRATFLFLALAAVCFGSVFASAPSNQGKLNRQIEVMEGILDKVLLDSPNFLVHTGPNADGFYLPDYGAVFTFEASLTENYFGDGNWLIGPGSVEIQKHDGDRTIVIHKKGPGWQGLFGKHDEDRTPKDPVALYERGKEELVQAILDYAETLGALPSEQAVVIVARMTDTQLADKKKIHQVMLRARMEDLKAYTDERISESEMKSRIRIEES